MNDLDRLLELFRGGACDPDTIITTLIERVKEAERAQRILTERGNHVSECLVLHFENEKLQERVKEAEKERDAWHDKLRYDTIGEELVDSLEARLRAAEEVVEKTRYGRFDVYVDPEGKEYRSLIFTYEPLDELEDALRAYNEAVARVKE